MHSGEKHLCSAFEASFGMVGNHKYFYHLRFYILSHFEKCACNKYMGCLYTRHANENMLDLTCHNISFVWLESLILPG